MIEKRFQTYSKEGLTWSRWFKFSNSNNPHEAERLNRSPEQKWQLKNKLRNEFRLVATR